MDFASPPPFFAPQRWSAISVTDLKHTTLSTVLPTHRRRLQSVPAVYFLFLFPTSHNRCRSFLVTATTSKSHYSPPFSLGSYRHYNCDPRSDFYLKIFRFRVVKNTILHGVWAIQKSWFFHIRWIESQINVGGITKLVISKVPPG